MQITRTADYALRAAVYLAEVGPERYIAAAEIARAQDIPPDYIPKVLQALSRAGIVATVPGRGGGASLLRDPTELSVLDVVEAVDGPVLLNRCLLREGECARDASCGAHRFWHRVQASLTEMLSQAKVAQFCGGGENLRPAAETRQAAGES